jgi:hypothetical protein
MQREARGLVPAANPYMTPLSPNPVYTLAAAFIVSCPTTNAPLPFMAFPPLVSADNGSEQAMGMVVDFTIKGDCKDKYVTFVSGLVISSVKIEDEGSEFGVKVPMGISGQTYAFLTNANVNGGPGALMDSMIVNGPAILEITPAAPTYDPSYQ